MGAIVAKEIMCPHRCIPMVISVSRACRFAAVRVIFGFPKRVIPLCLRTLWEICFVNFQALLYPITSITGFLLIKVITRVAYK